MKVVKGLVALVLFFGVLYIGIQFARDNNQVVSLKMPGGFETLGVELWAMVIIAAGAGAALAAFVFLLQIVAAGFGKRKLARRVKVLERELNDLRNMPLSTAKAPEISAPAGGLSETPSETAGQPGEAPPV
ncbi:MAG: hypothetical protein ACE5FC_03265 [Myxococcota bacterium]